MIVTIVLVKIAQPKVALLFFNVKIAIIPYILGL